jgi:REP element-mobilizing transposase RayT
MARKPRIEYPGAFLHVIARGNNRQEIFHDDEDRRHYFEGLKEKGGRLESDLVH